MIVKIGQNGKSFKGLSEYLTHDPEARTDERVAWTHTHNLAEDDVPSAVNLMYLTAENAELLKQEAGVRGGGRATESPVKHVNLNWAPDEKPTREHMIQTAEGFLRHMKWQEHQAIMVAHDDKHPHVHVMINVVHPETGLRLNDDFERRRAQKWALEYERENGRIYCEQRLKKPDEREKNMPRNIWMEFGDSEKEFLKSEEILRKNSDIPEYSPKNRKSEEWEILKQIQRDEREQHFADGKTQFKELRQSVSREIRHKFRERWADYFKAVKNGTEADKEILAKTKAELIADQKAALQPRRDAACAELKKARDLEYRELLDGQKAVRAEFGARLETGLDNADFFHGLLEKKGSQKDLVALGFREASIEVTTNFEGQQLRSPARAEVEDTPDRSARSHRKRDVADIGKRWALGTVGAVADSVFSFLTNLGSAPPQPISAEERADQFREAAESALKQQNQQHKREEDAARWRERQRSYGE